MSRYTGAKVRKMRALGTYLPGLSGKSMEHRQTKPGQHGQGVTRRKLSDFGVQLIEKQKLQFNYGLREKNLSRLVKEARKSDVASGGKLAELLRERLHFGRMQCGRQHECQQTGTKVVKRCVRVCMCASA